MTYVRQALYRLGDRLYGWGVLDCLQQFHQMQRWDAGRVEQFQQEALRRLLDHAYANVPFYRRLWDDAGIAPRDVASLADLSRLPRVTKRMLVEAGDDSLDASRPKGSFLRGQSSGSTGTRFTFYKCKAHQGWNAAGTFFLFNQAGWNFGDRWLRQQFRGKLELRQKLEDFSLNCLYMPMGDFDETLLARFADKAAAFGPVMLRAYAGGAYLFARYLLDRGDERIRPKVVVTTGDTLYPHYRQAIEQAFGCRVVDTYGGEGMMVAGQCRAGAYHVLPHIRMEHQPVQADAGLQEGQGHPGRVLLTALFNTAMPMIRYDIDDLAVASSGGECECGCAWQRFAQVIGRDVDVVVTPAGRFLLVHHFNFVLSKFAGISQFQVVQSDPASIALRLAVNDGYDRAGDEPAIVDALGRIGTGGLRIDIQYVTDIPTPPTGKRRFVISAIGPAVTRPADRKAPRP